jgi:hypothetical protein
MELVRLSIPHGFVRGRIRMNWREVLFGLQEELLDPTAPTELAAEHLAATECSDSTLIELAGLDRSEDARTYVERLAAKESEESVQEIRAKWLWIVLGWIFEHRDEYSDPLRAVEEVYADFDYPERIAEFVRYMPSDEPNLGSRERNEARLYGKWSSYLQECFELYASDLPARSC